jgi:hypothetical protein
MLPARLTDDMTNLTYSTFMFSTIKNVSIILHVFNNL